jgi:homoserine dehydrogenase
MGGSHPAYEYTVAALKAGKSVITSNKEVVANFGDEFLALAAEHGVCYRFEAAVGGGIPVISPMINCIGQNKIREVRGILNGTTNYILTKMFSFGDSFEAALASAQEKGYAESNPDADILGTDACRKIVILTALATGKLYSPASVHTEGITDIRAEDVLAARKIGSAIKLLGRCIIDGETPKIMVAPFMLTEDLPLSNVNGVFNAVETISEPLTNVMFYGPGAGAGPTASAMVGDLMQVMCSGRQCAHPVFVKDSGDLAAAFDSFVCKNYLAFPEGCGRSITEVFEGAQFIESEDETLVITSPISECDMRDKLSLLAQKGIEPMSRIRLL